MSGGDADDGKVVVDVLEGSPAAVEQVVGKSAEAAPDLADDGMLDVVDEVRHSPRVRVVAKAVGGHEGPVHDESHRISDHRGAGIEQPLGAVQVDPPRGVGTEVLVVGGLAEAIAERAEEVLQEIVQCLLVVSVKGVRERSEVLGHEVSPLAPDSIGRRDRVGRPLHRVPGVHQALEQIGWRPSRRAPILEALGELRRGPVVGAQVSADVVVGHRCGLDPALDDSVGGRASRPSSGRTRVCQILAQNTMKPAHRPSQGNRAAVPDQSPAQTHQADSRLNPKVHAQDSDDLPNSA